jgi:hypothetical protein
MNRSDAVIIMLSSAVIKYLRSVNYVRKKKKIESIFYWNAKL